MKINTLIKNFTPDTYLYNLNITLTNAILDKFRDIKYVIMQGSNYRAKDFAEKLANTLLNIDNRFFTLINLTGTNSFVAYRVDDVLCVSHGMGNTSILTFLHNITKVLYYAGNTDLEYIRVGTSGGIGIPPGSVVLTNTAYMPNLIAGYTISAIGNDIIYPTNMNKQLNQLILMAQPSNLAFRILEGNTIAANDFYLGQARMDGAIKPKFDLKKRQEYFEKIKALNILNFEMESTGLASFCNRAEIPATQIATTLVNRELGDQVSISPEQLAEYSNHAQLVAINYITAVKNNLI